MKDPKVPELYSPPNKRKKPIALKAPVSIQKQLWTGSQPQKFLSVLTNLGTDEMIGTDINCRKYQKTSFENLLPLSSIEEAELHGFDTCTCTGGRL